MSPSASRPKRLLVSGGRGRLAALVAGHFGAPAYESRLFSREGGAGLHPLVDLATPAALTGADALLHLAWSSLPATAELAPDGAEDADLTLLEKILAALASVPPAQRPHFIFFSSGGTVYGNAPGRPNRETDACQPIGRYGRAKLAAEEMIRAAIARDHLSATILRISNPYGYPVPSGRVQGIIPHAIRCAVTGDTLPLWGDGRAQKDFLHYSDFLAALQLVVERRLPGTFNLAAGHSHSVHEILQLVEKHTGRTIATQSTAAPAWDVQDSRLDQQLFAGATGWRPLVDLDAGIRRAVTTHPTA